MALSLILGIHPGLALVLCLIILLVRLLCPKLCLLPKMKRRKGTLRLLQTTVEQTFWKTRVLDITVWGLPSKVSTHVHMCKAKKL